LRAFRCCLDITEKSEVIGKQFELAAIRESALPRLGFVIDLLKFLIDEGIASTDQLARRWQVWVTLLTTTRDFFTPKMGSLER